MSIDEARRLLLHDAARTAWGAEAALVLMEMLPPTGWADVATRQELGHLEARIGQRIDQLEARTDHRFDQVNARFDQVEARLDHRIDALELKLNARLADGQRRAIQWNVATLIALAAAVTAVVRLG